MQKRSPRPFRVAAVLFDFDETLTAPGAIDFQAIRRRVGCPDDRPILEYIAALADEPARREALAIVHEVEIEAAARSVPNHGAEELVCWLRELGLPLAIQTRNSRASIDRAFANFQAISAADFEVIITRDDDLAPKPHPGGILTAAAHMGVTPAQMLVVGDHVFEMMAGRRAGAMTVLLEGEESMVPPDLPDFEVATLADVRAVVQLGLPLPAGKVPADLLEDFLDRLPHDDPSVLVPPRVGEDVTVVDASPGGLISLGADPITFAAESPGAWALVVNANDIAVCGADPRWFLATVLLPLGSTPSGVIALLEGIGSACAANGVTLCGGHTEVTDAVTRAVVCGTMLGTFGARGLIDKRGMRTGDAVVMTKRIAVEGTALLAVELADELAGNGMTGDELSRSVRLRASLGVLVEARVAAGVAGVRAMHDVTEGGLATAMVELAAAGEHAIGVDADAVPLYEETRRICELLDADPLGLIGSGSLLICCAPEQTADLLVRLTRAGVEAARIGTVLEPGSGVRAWHGCSDPETAARRGCAAAGWPAFAVDEVARVLEARGSTC